MFQRDGKKCVNCSDAVGPHDAHHIFERKLWSNGGYYLENGATLCEACHRLAESTILSVEDLHRKIGADKYPIPETFVQEEPYDKWGNPILPSGKRTKGPLFLEHQKVLSPVSHLFIDKVKYPRTFHLPWSPGILSDDRVMESLDEFRGQRVIVTEKLDGENTTLSREGVHARSVEGYHSHPSRSHMKILHARVGYEIPVGWRICGENVWGVHSIHYKELDNYFQVFSVWNEVNLCASWDDTVLYAKVLGLTAVPVLYDGIWEDFDRKFTKRNEDEIEGYVVRIADSFDFRQFSSKVGKYVRENHVRESSHWKAGKVRQNILRK